jgi:transcriptional regulator with XRE-family HTH domain
MAPKHRQFAKYLTTHRQAAGLSMDALAERVGASKSSVHYWESGEWLPSLGQLEPLAQALGVSYEDLFAKAGFDPATLPEPEPYLRAKFPGASKRKLAEAKRLFEQIDASERRRKGGRR